MRHFYKFSILLLVFTVISCSKFDDFLGDGKDDDDDYDDPISVNFQYRSTLQVGGEGASEIAAFDPETNKLFVVNVESTVISVFDISNVDSPVVLSPIDISAFGAPNSVAVHDEMLAVAVEAAVKQDPGQILIFDTETQMLSASYPAGALPDMVTFSPNGKYVIAANEGEPDDNYLNDPEGSITIVNLKSGNIKTADFNSFNSQESSLEDKGFRVFGPNANLAQDVEPEYIVVSADSKTAWVALQENNGVARVNLNSGRVTDIYPLGFKDYSMPGNKIDASNKDGDIILKNWPVFGIYHPDAIEYVNINGAEYIITANEGDAREYEGTPGFIEEERIKDIVLDPTAFPDAAILQEEANLGRLKITTTLGDLDNDGDFDELYSFGARSFTIWTTNGQMVYDSGDDIAFQTSALTPESFNGGKEPTGEFDDRSDDKGAEPEAVEVLNIDDERYILFVGLERNDQVMVYDITNPYAPVFLDILSNDGDDAPEGVLAIPAADSPTGKDLLVVSNEDSGTVSFYENK
ncbi:choice-of-anchor I family protein [Flavobacteriaceae bacterium D16]|nr:choice-of-anchor I family protein [Flavobacteriaceae bacterium D16]